MPYRDPNTARSYWREYRRTRRHGGCSTPGSTQVPPEFRLQVAADVLALIEDQCEAVLEDADAGTLEKARCVGYLAGVALKAIEAGNLAARLEALELVLKARTENGKP